VLKSGFNRRPLIGDASVPLWASPRGICDGLSGTGSGLSPGASVFRCQSYFTNASDTHFHLCDYSLEIGVVEEWEASNKAKLFLQILSDFKEILLFCAQRVKATALESRNKFLCIYLINLKQIYKPMSVYRG
jgi:hypothetical protein